MRPRSTTETKHATASTVATTKVCGTVSPSNAYWLRDIGVEPRMPDTTVERIRIGGRPWF
jgi:hypothetical protein